MKNVSEYWIAVELSPLGDQKVEEGKLESILRGLLPKSDYPISIFVPAAQIHKNGRPYMYRLMEGYAFIEGSLRDTDYFKLERSPYIDSVMSFPSEESIRTCKRIPNSDIQTLQNKLYSISSSNLSVGNWVSILNGSYARMEGEVVNIRDNVADVLIELRSLKMIVPINNTSLEIQEEKTARSELWDLGVYAELPSRCAPLSVFEIRLHIGEIDNE